MQTEAMMNDDELTGVINRVWASSKETMLKQVEYAIQSELSQRAGARAKQLVSRELDTILKPKLEAMRQTLEERAQKIADNLIGRLEEAMRIGLENAIKDTSEHVVRQILSQSESRIRNMMVEAIKG